MRKHCGNCANHKKETNQFSEECGKCVSAILENGETTDPSHWRALPQTNADRIRAMSDEELAEFICGVYDEEEDSAKVINGCYIPCYDQYSIKEWIKQPAGK